MFHRFLHSGADAGATDKPQDPPAAGTGGKEGSAGESKNEPPKTTEEWQALHEKSNAESKATITELNSKLDRLEKTVGNQGNELGVWRGFQNELKANPTAALRKFMQNSGISLEIGGEANKDLDSLLKKVINSDEGASTGDFITKLQKLTADAVLSQLSPQLISLAEAQVAQKYKDWSDMEPARQTLESGFQTGQFSKSELFHLAARGLNLAVAMEQVKTETAAETRAAVEKEIGEKMRQFEGTGGRGGPTTEEQKKAAESEAAARKSAIDKMNTTF